MKEKFNAFHRRVYPIMFNGPIQMIGIFGGFLLSRILRTQPLVYLSLPETVVATVVIVLIMSIAGYLGLKEPIMESMINETKQ